MAVEKTAEELRKEIEELHRQQHEITSRLRDPRGLRRSALSAGRPSATVRPRELARTVGAADADDQPEPKRRLSSTVVRVEVGETEEASGAAASKAKGEVTESRSDPPPDDARGTARMGTVQSHSNGLRRDTNPRAKRRDMEDPPEPVPRVFPKMEDPALVKRNKRMLGQLLGTLEKFREEDKQLASREAYARRSDLLRRAEEKAREESERLRQQEREQIAEKRRRDLTLRARVAAKADEKKLELLFLHWAEHHKRLCNFLRTKTEPAIYYMPTKPLLDDASILEKQKEQEFLEWKSARRAELSEYQKQIGEQYLANVEVELDRWQNTRYARRANNLVNLQETMDKELESHRLEHGPKTRRIGGSNVEEEDVEDIAAEDEMMDEVLEVQGRTDADVSRPGESGHKNLAAAVMQQ